MSIQLLDKTRKINKLLHNNTSSVFAFNDICVVLGDVLKSNVVVISKSGKILGINNQENVETLTEYMKNSVGEYIDNELNNRLLEILSTKENVNLFTLGFEGENNKEYCAIITPIDIAGERLGTLFIYRIRENYDIDDIILSEYGNTVVGLEMIRSISDENSRDEQNKNLVEGAINTLSSSEKKAILALLETLKANEGIIVASRVAADSGITRSVIVNAIRKFESAGVIETHSNGMKGTYIKIINNTVSGLIEKIKSKEQ